MSKKPDAPIALSDVRGQYEQALKAYIQAAGMLAITVQNALSLDESLDPAKRMNKALRESLSEQLKVFLTVQ